MKINSWLLQGFFIAALSAVVGIATEYTSDENFEVATLILNLSKSIAADLDPPATGAERTVTKALVSDEGQSRVYHIEGKDVYHTGRVLSTYWLRLTTSRTGASVAVMDSREPARGRAVSQETQRLIAPLLNSVYEIAELDIDHRRIVLEQISEPSSEPLVLEIVGLNNICIHDDLNRFRLTLSRLWERNRANYIVNFDHPFSYGETPVLPLPIDIPASSNN